MKKLLGLLLCVITAAPLVAQEKSKDFDSKNRFGLRITPQPTWFVSGDKNNIPAGAVLGFGFGLNFERRFSEIAALVTGIGGDFEGGKYTLKNDPGNYEVYYWHDEAGEFVAPTANKTKGMTRYHVEARKISVAFVSIPLILKLSTNEYNGLKYFGMFGGELGVRIKATSDDTYFGSRTYITDTSYTEAGPSTLEDINISEEGGTLPVRFGMNAGAGVEYRMGGSTSLFLSLNFFRNFTNLLEKDSEFAYYKQEAGGYKMVKSNLKLTGVRINIGVMF